MPQVSSVFFNWSSSVQMKIVNQRPVDFELQEDVTAVPTLDMVLSVQSPRAVQRKPEGERRYKWYEGWTTAAIKVDQVLQDPQGLQFRVQSVYDWSQGGFFHCELVEQPHGEGMSNEF